jgi:hypothetical protein
VPGQISELPRIGTCTSETAGVRPQDRDQDRVGLGFLHLEHGRREIGGAGGEGHRVENLYIVLLGQFDPEIDSRLAAGLAHVAHDDDLLDVLVVLQEVVHRFGHPGIVGIGEPQRPRPDRQVGFVGIDVDGRKLQLIDERGRHFPLRSRQWADDADRACRHGLADAQHTLIGLQLVIVMQHDDLAAVDATLRIDVGHAKVDGDGLQLADECLNAGQGRGVSELDGWFFLRRGRLQHGPCGQSRHGQPRPFGVTHHQHFSNVRRHARRFVHAKRCKAHATRFMRPTKQTSPCLTSEAPKTCPYKYDEAAFDRSDAICDVARHTSKQDSSLHRTRRGQRTETGAHTHEHHQA